MTDNSSSSAFNINTGIQVTIPRQTIMELLFLGIALILFYFMVRRLFGH